jgi:hypothetical protein
MRKHLKRIVQSGGVAPDGKIPFPLITKGESFYQMWMTEAWFKGE